jgi:hypothetical protein
MVRGRAARGVILGLTERRARHELVVSHSTTLDLASMNDL